jgi:hypothetical protein
LLSRDCHCFVNPAVEHQRPAQYEHRHLVLRLYRQRLASEALCGLQRRLANICQRYVTASV